IVSRGECLKLVTPPPVSANRVQRLRERALGSAVKPITALVEKTGMEYTALKADRIVSRGECLKLVTPPLVSSNRVQRNVKKVV
ncbi:MAG: hypothetical protein II964_01515, partial [Synergistaceae bacterium]|nr:hypothetical protein [Synergistaceae bacterium]